MIRLATALSLLAAPALAQAPAAPAADVGPPPPVAAPVDPPVDPALEAELLAGTTSEASGEHERLALYGFADFNWFQPLDRSSPWFQFLPEHPTFMVGSLNLYLDANLAPRWRALAEVRLLYSPQGARIGPDQAGVETVENTQVEDLAEFGRNIRWGGIAIQRAWLEYQLHPLLTVRGGHFLSPFGIWNVDHSTVTVIGVRQPFVVRGNWYPESQAGLELYGAADLAAVRVGYHLTLSNGDGLSHTVRDYDTNKSIGARAYATGFGALDWTAGASFYGGRESWVRYQWGLGDDGRPKREQVYVSSQDKRTIATDLRLGYRGFVLHSEWLLTERAYRDGGRRMVDAPPARWHSDSWAWGGYVLLAYRIERWHLMPYLTTEFMREDYFAEFNLIAGEYGDPLVFYPGINFRPLSHVVFKLELQHGRFLGAKPGSWGRHPFTSLQAQAAWAF